MASTDASPAVAAAPADDGRVAILEAALWKRLTDAPDLPALAAAWIALQCGLIAGAARGLVAFADEHEMPRPAACWPEGSVPQELLATARAAIAQRRGVVQQPVGGEPALGARVQLGYPVLLGERVAGAAVVELQGDVSQDLRRATRQLQWGAAWLRERLLLDSSGDRERRMRMSVIALDLLAVALEAQGFQAACRAVATALAHEFACERVSIGFVRRGQVRVAVISHSAQFGRHMNTVRILGDAMDEAVDQRAAIVYPSSPDEPHSTHAHAAVAAANGSDTLLTLPLFTHDRFIGAITLERRLQGRFDAETMTLMDGVVCALAPVFEAKRRDDRWLVTKIAEALGRQVARLLGPGHWARKLAVAAALAIGAAGYWWTDTYRVTGEATIEGQIQRTMVAAFNGFIKEAPVRAGDHVAEGQTLASLDDRDLVLERLRWVTERQRKVFEHEKAIGERNRADVKIIAAQIEQADAQIKLVDEQLAHARVTAPFDGLVVSGDLTQSVGAAVQRGQQLFEIAPLDSYRVALEIDESQIRDVTVSQAGRLVVASLPHETFALTVAKITPVAKAHDGHNYFRVEALLTEAAPQLRPGMHGAAKLDVDERRVAWIWARAFIDWVTLFVWRWFG
jgi:RND family efflux transporter MFP subunit